MMAERIGVTHQTYGRIEAGDPTVAMGTYLLSLAEDFGLSTSRAP